MKNKIKKTKKDRKLKKATLSKASGGDYKPVIPIDRLYADPLIRH